MDVREIGRLLKQLSDKMEATANADLKKIDLTIAQSRVLLFLDEMPGKQATQRELEEHLDVSHATIHGILARMDAKGLVHVTASDKDRRMRIVQLNTNDQTLNQIRAQQEEHMLKITQGLDTTEVFKLVQALLENHAKYLANREGE